jgi:hypothetical protein
VEVAKDNSKTEQKSLNSTLSMVEGLTRAHRLEQLKTYLMFKKANSIALQDKYLKMHTKDVFESFVFEEAVKAQLLACLEYKHELKLADFFQEHIADIENLKIQQAKQTAEFLSQGTCIDFML